jgi:pyruvate kinase
MRHERRRVLRRTKIVCTIGPATREPEMLERLVRVGMDCARINFSHGALDEHRETIARVRAAQASCNRPLAILADLQGPKLRVGQLSEARVLAKGEEIVLAGRGSAQDGDLELDFEVDFAKHVRRGRPVLINDGHVRLRVREARGQRCRCVVEVAGPVTSYKGVNLPGTYLPIPSITEKDREHLAFAVEQDADYVALSFVRRAEDVEDLRAMIAELGGRQRVIAKIEKAEAVEQLDAIVAAADGLMVRAATSASRSGPPTCRWCRSGSSASAAPRASP